MEKKQIKPLVILAVFILPLAIIIAAVPPSSLKKNELLSPNALLQSFNDGVFYIQPDVIADVLVKQDPSYQIIDVRTPEEFNVFHIPNSINIPLHDILSEEWTDYINQDVYTNVFYSNGTVKANQAWMMCRVRGYQNNYVMQGGLNAWAETIMNPTKPSSTASDDEFAKYNFRKAANSALGGGKLEEASAEVPAATKPRAPIKKKKKRAVGGCS